MGNPIAYLRDDFADNTIAATWTGAVSGSATVAESGGQAVLTLPSATVGSHVARYTSNATYDLTGDQFVWNIGTMVATGVAASALLQLLANGDGLYWNQVGGSLTARTVVAGVNTALFTVTWNASTYKYLRIRESGGTIFYDSSLNGIAWTNRASVATPFAVTDLTAQFAVTGGNIASPGSLRLDDVNLILPALSSTWRWTQVEWSLLNRFRTITIAAELGKQGYIAVASSIDASGNLVSPAYYSGPLGSASGGYNALTLAATQAQAQSMAVNLPLDGRWDLPAIVEARFFRLYHRSTDGASHKAFEYYARRLVQADDIEAESIRAINIAAGAITADKISVLTLGAITANIGKLNIDTTGYLYQGTGTGDVPVTGLKIFNSGGIGKLSTYNSGVEQVTLDTDGKLKAGAGVVLLDATGIAIDLPTAASPAGAYRFTKAGVLKSSMYGYYNSGTLNGLVIQTEPDTAVDSLLNIFSQGGVGRGSSLFLRSDADNGSKVAEIDMVASVSNATITFTSSGGIFFNHQIKALASINPSRSSGGAVFGLDATSQGSALSIANNATATAFGASRNFSGLIIISETAITGSAAAFLVDGGNAIVLMSQTGANYSTTATTASKTNVYLVSGAVTIENKLGSTATYNIMAIRTRTS